MRVWGWVGAVTALALGLAAATGASVSRPAVTYADAGRQAVATLLGVYYHGDGLWNECDQPNCSPVNSDWGVDSLTYALALRWQTAHDPAVPPVMAALTATSPSYPAACTGVSCRSWSDVPEWDAIASARAYGVSRDPVALAKARAAFAFVEGSDVYALGACPDIRYQQPFGQANRLKTLETDANAVKAAILLHQATGEDEYLRSAITRYAAIRAHFLDPKLPLYSVYVFDDGSSCTPLPHRFFASVNGDMIWSGLELSRATGDGAYLEQALATARAVTSRLADPAGVFADLQAENDVVEPLVEAMYALATEAGAGFARAWIIVNAAAALSARTGDGSFGRFFDGPPPAGTVTAWQTNGGLALEIAAAALDPGGAVPAGGRWTAARRVSRSLGPVDAINFAGSGIALIGTLGESCCEPGHARVLIDGQETVDGTGIWQNKSSLGRRLPGELLLAWRWPGTGRHTISFEPGVPNGKEGPSFLHIRAYLVLP